jgi:cytoskeletal protein CcmA (bactofilin family)
MRLKSVIILLVVLLLQTLHIASAREIIRGDDCTIGAGQVIEGNVFVLCRTFKLNGEITGDLIGAAFTSELNGPVSGNVYMLAGQMDARSRVGRDLLFAGPVLRVHPTMSFVDERSSLMSLSLSTEIQDGARVPGNLTSLSYQMILDGDVGGEISFWGSALRIAGAVGGDVDATVGDPQLGDASQLQTLLTPFRFDVRLISPGLTVSEQAAISGQLTYTSTSEGTIEGTLPYPPVFQQIVTTPDFSQIGSVDEETGAPWLASYLGIVVREFITLGAIGLLGVYFLPRALQVPAQQIRSRPLNSLGAGILSFILSIGVWVLVLLLIILTTLVFVTLSLPDLVIVGMIAIGVLNIGGASAFYFIAIYVSRVIVCLAMGRALVRLALGDDGGMIYLHLLVGVALLSLLVFIPVVGGAINAVTLALGLGAIFLTFTQVRGTPRRQVAPMTLPVAPQNARQIPPPVVGDAPRGPGMDNLPEGFRWWDEN